MDLSPRDTGDVSGGRDSGVKSSFKNNNVFLRCVNCRGLPDAGDKLRSCSACQVAKYCSRTCQVTDWSHHKRFCASIAAERKGALAVTGGAAHGPDSAKKLLHASLTTAAQWYDAHPEVFLRVQFLAWKHRQEQPLLVVTTASLSDDSDVQLEVVPRRQWEVDDNEHNQGSLASILYFFEKSDFDTHYISVIKVAEDCSCSMGQRSYTASAVRRLRSCMSLALTSKEYVAEMQRRLKDPDAVYVRLTGLCDAAHFNGHEGVLMTGEDPHHPGRCTIRLESGKDIRVRPENFKMVSRPELPPE